MGFCFGRRLTQMNADRKYSDLWQVTTTGPAWRKNPLVVNSLTFNADFQADTLPVNGITNANGLIPPMLQLTGRWMWLAGLLLSCTPMQAQRVGVQLKNRRRCQPCSV